MLRRRRSRAAVGGHHRRPPIAVAQELAPSDDLYALAEDFEPGEPGDVIAYQEVTGLDVDGTVLRVLYHSESLEGDDIAVSGIIVVPDGRRARRAVARCSPGPTAPPASPTSAHPARSPAARTSPWWARSSSATWSSRPRTTRASAPPAATRTSSGESEARGTLDIVRAAQQLEEHHGRVGRGRALGPLPGRARGPVRQPDRRGVGSRARRRRHGGRRAAVAAPADRRRPARQPLSLLPGHDGRRLERRLPGGRPVAGALAARDRAPRRGRRGLRGRPRGGLERRCPTKTSSPPIPTTSSRGRPCSSRTIPASSSASRRC